MIPIVLGVLLVIAALQVGVVRFVNPPRTLPMWIEQASSKRPLLYRWIDLPQIPEMFLEHNPVRIAETGYRKVFVREPQARCRPST